MTASLLPDFAAKILAGDRRALARAITLVESARADHRAQAAALLEALAPAGRQALRIGLSGTPGVGKSTFIESFGTMLIGQGLKVAVLAVDPSSARSGGSILGDKTRMERLSVHPRAFIRPSPSSGTLGGVVLGLANVFSEQLRGTVSMGWVRSRNRLGDAYVSAYGDTGNLRLLQWHAGLYYTPIKNVELGGELLGGRRTTYGGATGDMTRLNLQARYLFN